ncbi:Peptidase A1 domain containing protein [Aphelenchoides besseyi]|nr:Peptidase A1 domain containing protein [Aphelenchoides besseyi]KAI6210934.1 Peptidase A1 domain containing protein [Aphelenchoides besseyi]
MALAIEPKMKLSILGLLVAVLLFVDLSESFTLSGQSRHNTVEKLRRYQELKRQSRIKKFYMPEYPEAPLTVSVSIGGSVYQLSVETGQTSLWTLSPNYTELTKDNKPYEPSESKTSWKVDDYFSGITGNFRVYGGLYGDMVSVSNETSFNQTFGLISATNGIIDPWYDSTFDGIDGALGLGWDPTNVPSTPNYYSEPIHNILHNAKDIKRGNKFYVLWMANADQQLTNDGTGHHYNWEISFGKIDHNLCERNFNMTSLLSSSLSTPAFQLSQFSFGDYTYDMEDNYVSVDTGSPVIYMPSEVYEKIFDVISPTYDWDTGLYTVNCKNAGTYDPWIFSLDGVDYTVPSSTYVVDIGIGDGQCVLSYGLSNSYTANWVLGNPWLIEHCVLFDIKGSQIGFAKPKPSASVSTTAKPTTQKK